jgi:hypothetical protein
LKFKELLNDQTHIPLQFKMLDFPSKNETSMHVIAFFLQSPFFFFETGNKPHTVLVSAMQASLCKLHGESSLCQNLAMLIHTDYNNAVSERDSAIVMLDPHLVHRLEPEQGKTNK